MISHWSTENFKDNLKKSQEDYDLNTTKEVGMKKNKEVCLCFMFFCSILKQNLHLKCALLDLWKYSTQNSLVTSIFRLEKGDSKTKQVWDTHAKAIYNTQNYLLP